MKLTTRTRYGTRALFELARAYPGGGVSVKEMAERQRLSPKYLEKIMATLKAAGLVTAATGVHGGYALTRSPERIRISEIFAALEGPAELVECLRSDAACPLEGVCPTQSLWREMTDAIVDILEGTTLQDLAERKGSLHFAPAPTYSI